MNFPSVYYFPYIYNLKTSSCVIKPPSDIAFPYPYIVQRLVEFISIYAHRACFYFNSSLFIIPVCDSLLELEFVDRLYFQSNVEGARWNNFGYQGPYDWNVYYMIDSICASILSIHVSSAALPSSGASSMRYWRQISRLRHWFASFSRIALRKLFSLLRIIKYITFCFEISFKIKWTFYRG